MPSTEDRDEPALLLVVNVRSRWSEVTRGAATDEEVVLGDWNLAARDIDARRVIAVLGCVRRTIVRAWRVTGAAPVGDYDQPRVRFQPGDRLSHLEGEPSPYIWQRGERYPVVAIPADRVPLDLTPAPPLDLGPTGQATIGGYTLRVDARTAVVTVPAGHQITVAYAGDRTAHVMQDEAALLQPLPPGPLLRSTQAEPEPPR